MLYPDLSALNFGGLRDVWKTHPDPGFAEQAHVQMADQVYAQRGWGRGTRVGIEMETHPLF